MLETERTMAILQGTEKMGAKLNHQKKAGTVQTTLSKFFTKK